MFHRSGVLAEVKKSSDSHAERLENLSENLDRHGNKASSRLGELFEKIQAHDNVLQHVWERLVKPGNNTKEFFNQSLDSS